MLTKEEAIRMLRSASTISREKAIEVQLALRGLVSTASEIRSEPAHIAGVDVAYSHGESIGAAVLLKYRSLEPVERCSSALKVTFPYVPGLLAFREAPAILAAIDQLKTRPDVCLIDGHGLAHPRRFGLACYVGLASGLPTIGVAKSLLYGDVRDGRILDREGTVIGAIVKAPNRRRNFYVSVGHKVSLEDALSIVEHCLTDEGPKPLVLAHEEASRLRWALDR